MSFVDFTFIEDERFQEYSFYILPSVRSLLWNFLYILWWFISRQRFWNIISLKENCFVNEHLLSLIMMICTAKLRQRVYFPFSLHVWGLSGCPYGSNIKLCSGLSISRSSKYSYHIRPEGGTPVVQDHHVVDASSVCPKEPAWGTQRRNAPISIISRDIKSRDIERYWRTTSSYLCFAGK